MKKLTNEQLDLLITMSEEMYKQYYTNTAPVIALAKMSLIPGVKERAEENQDIFNKQLEFIKDTINAIKGMKPLKIRAYPQSMDKLNIKGNAHELLTDLGFVIISWGYDGHVPMFFFEVEPTELKVPEWAEKY